MNRVVAGSALAVGTTLAILLTGCSGVSVGALPGGSVVAGGSTPAAGHAGASAAPKAAPCTPNGTSIPEGHYKGKIDSTVDLVMTITADGISIPNAGGGKEHWLGTIDLISKDGSVNGTIDLTELGLSQVGQPGSVQVHSQDSGDLKGGISGTAAAPAVAATGNGEWTSLDAPVVGGSGTSTNKLNGGLHITKADCASISGDFVGMFSDFLKPVSKYLSVSGNGTWVATRQ
jgi:hypothetical protein